VTKPDPRVDKVISWALMAFAGLALSVGAWFFNGLGTEIGKLREAVSELKTQVSVQAERDREIEKIREDSKAVKARIRDLEKAVIGLGRGGK